MTTDLPPKTVEWVFPPNKEYEYFASRDNHPFLGAANEFSLANAWWLAEASLLAYAAPDFAVPKFQSAGLTVENDTCFSGRSTQCYVAYTNDFVIVAFRGTQVYKPGTDQGISEVIRDVLADFLIDEKFGLVPFANGGFVHRGFLAGLDEVWQNGLQVCLERLHNENKARRLYFTGHSLGAALATLAVTYCLKTASLYTFGSPFVGDADFHKICQFPAYRIVNNNDIVPTVPPFGPYVDGKIGAGKYWHIGKLKYIQSDGTISDDSSALLRIIDEARGRLQHLFESFEQFRRDWIVELPDDGLNDHGPIYYAISLRQNLET